MKVIFVCTGNTCRSPVAEAMFRRISNNDDIKISSRGLAACNGEAASTNSVIVAEEYGIDISGHKSQNLTEEDIIDADYIFCMTNFQANMLKNAFHMYSTKIFSIDEITGCGDISDPYGGSVDDYRKCASQIYDSLKIIFEKISGN